MRRIFKKYLLAIVANGVALWIAAQIFPEKIHILASPPWIGFVVVGVAIGIVNTFVRPILKLLSLPFVMLTMGLFLIVINAIVVWIVEWVFRELLTTSIQLIITGGFASYVLVGFTLGIINTVLHWILKEHHR